MSTSQDAIIANNILENICIDGGVGTVAKIGAIVLRSIINANITNNIIKYVYTRDTFGIDVFSNADNLNVSQRVNITNNIIDTIASKGISVLGNEFNIANNHITNTNLNTSSRRLPIIRNKCKWINYRK